MKRALRYAVFDLDNTLYPPDSKMMEVLGRRIQQYMTDRVGLPRELVRPLRDRYFEQYGTTLSGLIAEHHVDAQEYLAFVHDFPVEEMICPNPELDAALDSTNLEKVVFTNASAQHAWRVLRALGIERHFTRVFDVVAMEYVSKPALQVYLRLLERLPARGGECILFEDSIRNLRPAARLGMVTVLVGEGSEGEEVDFVVPSITDIGPLFKHLEANGWIAGDGAQGR
ncbi:MAG: pyrimidine 5'-nucleotidase [Chloroflexi bacterium]|nr:pyrimidine 5'-nucleotidase [Chloroflexota bacterium]